MSDLLSKTIVSGFIINKIKTIVKNPSAQKNLIDLDYPFGSKRPALDTSYYKTFNQNNVEIINLKSSKFQSVSASGLTINNKYLMLDMIIFATGFDAITGSLLNMDITGANKKKLSSEWHKKPNSYLGLQIPNFPNLFTITGPGSPSVLTNMPRAIEQHVDFIHNLIMHKKDNNYSAVYANSKNQDEWVKHNNDVAHSTLYPLAHSWYNGDNIVGKKKGFMPYVGGVANYKNICDEKVRNNYEGFEFS